MDVPTPHFTRSSSRGDWARKQSEKHPGQKGSTKTILLEDTYWHMENPTGYMQSRAKNELREVARDEVKRQKSVVGLYTSKELSENKIKNDSTDSHPLLVEIRNGKAASDSLGTSDQANHTPFIQPGNWAAWRLPRGEKNLCLHSKTCTQMFIAALFVSADTGKPPRCPLGGEWVHKRWHPQTTECDLAMKPKELPNHEKTRENLCWVSPSERSQSAKAPYWMSPTV